MSDKRCHRCCMLFPEEELLLTDDAREWICPDCSGLLADEDLGCHYVEEG